MGPGGPKCGHHVLDKDVLGEDTVLQGRTGGGVPIEDIYVCFYFCPFDWEIKGHALSTGMIGPSPS